MQKRLLTLLALSGLISLSGCFALRMELNDPLGLPLNHPVVGVSVQSQSAPPLAAQLQLELVQLLPRERHLQARALEMAKPMDWTLKIDLSQGRQLMEVPIPLLDPLGASERVRLELRLNAELSGPGIEPRRWELVQRGDARPDAEKDLTQELLRSLRDRLIQEMQPKYEYK